MENLDKLIKELEEKAAEQTHYEADPSYSPADNGNFDDAHSEGGDDADIHSARRFLPFLKELQLLRKESKGS